MTLMFFCHFIWRPFLLLNIWLSIQWWVLSACLSVCPSDILQPMLNPLRCGSVPYPVTCVIRGADLVEDGVLVLCPPDCTQVSVFGTKVYASVSSVCGAAVHRWDFHLSQTIYLSALQRAIGRLLPLQRAMGRFLPLQRAMGRLLPLQRAIGRLLPLQRAMGRFLPLQRAMGRLLPLAGQSPSPRGPPCLRPVSIFWQIPWQPWRVWVNFSRGRTFKVPLSVEGVSFKIQNLIIVSDPKV